MFARTGNDYLKQFNEKRLNGELLVGFAVDTVKTARCCENAGADFLILYSSGQFRSQGRGFLTGYLAYSDANKIIIETGAEILPMIRKTPVFAGICGTDPFRLMSFYLKELADLGFPGVHNFPSVGLIDGKFRESLEDIGRGYALEVEMIREAHNSSMITCPFVFNEEQAAGMTEAGADFLIIHPGLDIYEGNAAGEAETIRNLINRIRPIINTAKQHNSEIGILFFIESRQMVDNVSFLLEHVPEIDGFYVPAPPDIQISNEKMGELTDELKRFHTTR